jgi:hypothetical protein
MEITIKDHENLVPFVSIRRNHLFCCDGNVYVKLDMALSRRIGNSSTEDIHWCGKLVQEVKGLTVVV